MTVAQVTVVRCRACDGAPTLTLHEGRLWCARCQAWASLAIEHRLAAEPHAAAANGAEAGEALAPAASPRRQALRVPPGWRIEYHEWYEGELADPELQQDLLLATHAERDRVLDVSWYYGDRDAACYRVVAWAGREPAPLLHVAEHETPAAAVATVEHLLAVIAAGQL